MRDDPELDKHYKNKRFDATRNIFIYLFVGLKENDRSEEEEAEGDEYLFLFSGKNNVLLPCPKIITSTIIIS